ncbi:Alpha/Beta hydrolase protein [Teratosphaeria destructans]|uniref:Alpha/Beta hydrolase protein n=1 Tax=Teratosphaeria destructans TaxID=418781 RepID=A0A9W7SZ86_9PEZI|nr:Alpha/Beta hydrolase protein [Teratosphaeria destructans]
MPLSASQALLLAGAVAPAGAQLWNKTIQTTYGPVQGFKYFDQSTLETYFNISSSNVTAFLGIPYGADTAYENRWKPALPPPKWNTTLKATSFGPQCPTSTKPYGDGVVSEDCLSLNVWTNAASADARLPVMLWNQGSEEASNNTWWYGGGMALKDVILITFNRRDDAFGYLAHPDLNAEGYEQFGHETSGNYGVLDQLAVLKWIKANIANFGGDPDRVTIAGQSFGSSQVYHAVNSELFSGYFHGAISESGIRWPHDTMLAGLATSYLTMKDAIDFGINYTTYNNVTSVAELRKLPMEQLVQYSGDRVTNCSIDWITALNADYPLIFKPVLDGYVLPKKYIDSLIDGPANDVPVITGNTLDESGASTSTNYTLAEFEYYNQLKYGSLYDNFTELYPTNGNDTLANQQWNLAATDVNIVATGSTPQPGQSQGAFHQSEIMYALNALYANVDTYPFTSVDYEIQAKMSAYWANFAKTLDPNRGGSYVGRGVNGTLPRWSPNDANGTQFVFELGDSFGNIPIAKPGHVEFVEAFFARQAAY